MPGVAESLVGQSLGPRPMIFILTLWRTQRQPAMMPWCVGDVVLLLVRSPFEPTFAQAKTNGRMTKIFSSTSIGVCSWIKSAPESKAHQVASDFSPVALG